MRDARDANRKKRSPAKAAGRQDARGRLGKAPSDKPGDGAVEVSDPRMASDVTEVAYQVHANA